MQTPMVPAEAVWLDALSFAPASVSWARTHLRADAGSVAQLRQAIRARVVDEAAAPYEALCRQLDAGGTVEGGATAMSV